MVGSEVRFAVVMRLETSRSSQLSALSADRWLTWLTLRQEFWDDAAMDSLWSRDERR